jgi:hypothetical protein
MAQEPARIEVLDSSVVRVSAPFFTPAALKHEPRLVIGLVLGAALVVGVAVRQSTKPLATSPTMAGFTAVVISLFVALLLLVLLMVLLGRTVTTMDAEGMTVDWWLFGRRLLTAHHALWGASDVVVVIGAGPVAGVGTLGGGLPTGIVYGLGDEAAAQVAAAVQSIRVSAARPSAQSN